ncbi:hypothetical protein J0910_05215 [Nocardiopsis sp. CNT-189]|uniref:DUF7691 family protein n=1 Tax=Nocardiopsis oceanisediminis TaxID=2816862 RepID=UPI003B34F2E2
MSSVLRMTNGDMDDVLAMLGPAPLDDEQRRRLAYSERAAAEVDARLDHQGIDLGLSVGAALEHLVTGDEREEDKGTSYTYAFDCLVAPFFSDVYDLGAWSRSARFFSQMGAELRKLGVPDELCPTSFLFTGPPLEARIPHTPDGPVLGYLHSSKAEPLVKAYGEAIGRLPADYRYAAKIFIETMEVEVDSYEYGLKQGWNRTYNHFVLEG